MHMKVVRIICSGILSFMFPVRQQILNESYIAPNDESGIWCEQAKQSTLPPQNNGLIT